jgi:hypothetical protein
LLKLKSIGYSVAVERSLAVGELELVNQFRWIASHLRMSAKAPTERKRIRREISKLSDVVREKHIQHHLPFSCIDLHDECVGKRKRQRKSTYLCFLALYICLARLLAAITAAAKAGDHLR